MCLEYSPIIASTVPVSNPLSYPPMIFLEKFSFLFQLFFLELYFCLLILHDLFVRKVKGFVFEILKCQEKHCLLFFIVFLSYFLFSFYFNNYCFIYLFCLLVFVFIYLFIFVDVFFSLFFWGGGYDLLSANV